MHPLCVIALMLPLVSTGTRASASPLLVVVEAPPGLGVDRADVRETISAELKTPVLAPKDVGAGESLDLMIVALDRDNIRMSLRQQEALPVSRTIPMPVERAARLQAIAWLAGNLARDQVSALVAQAPPAIVAAPAATEPLPIVAAPAATEPPPLPPPTAQMAHAPVETLSAKREDPMALDGPSTWAVSFAAGPTATRTGRSDDRVGDDGQTYFGATYQFEIQRQAPGRFLFGVALDVGPTGDTYLRPHVLGGAAFFGSGWYRRRWFVEATAGVGLEAIRFPVYERSIATTSAGTSDQTTASTQLEAVMYGRVTGTLGLPLTPSLTLLGRVGVHVTSVGLPIVSAENRATDYASLSVGLRLRLP